MGWRWSASGFLKLSGIGALLGVHPFVGWEELHLFTLQLREGGRGSNCCNAREIVFGR